MPILDLQRQLRRLGKIRMGDQQPTKSGKTRPAKLTEWRLTSPSLELLEAAAAVYGGEPRPWEGAPGEGQQFELYTTSDTLDIIVPPAGALSQWYEMWSGGGCQRRCDGVTEQLSGDPCKCPADPDQRRVAAASGDACKITTRLSVILHRVPDVGMWMLECHGYYGAVELAGAEEILRMANAQGQMVPARLRIESRTSKRGGQTQHYIVPVIELPTLTAGTLLTGESPIPIDRPKPAQVAPPAPRAIEAAPQPAPAKAAQPAKKTAPRPRPPLPGEVEAKPNPYAKAIHVFAAEVAKATGYDADPLCDAAVFAATGGKSTSANDLKAFTKDIAVTFLADVRDAKLDLIAEVSEDGKVTYKPANPPLDAA